MKESTMRKWHRNIGIVIAFFIFLQAGSGIVLILKHISVPHSHAHEKEIKQASKEQVDSHKIHDHNSVNKETISTKDHEASEQKPNEIVKHGQDTQYIVKHENDRISFLAIIMGLHHGGGFFGAIYHLLIGIGMVVMALTGSMIFLKMQKRQSK